MGTWGYGPFDNDDATDFAVCLDAASEHERVALIRAALMAATDNQQYLDLDDGAPAVAAAALVASRLPGGEEFAPDHYGPTGPIPDLPSDFVPLAIKAVDRVLASASELQSLWAEDTRAERPWHSSVLRLRSALAGPDSGTPTSEDGS